MPTIPTPTRWVMYPTRRTLSRIFLPWKEAARLERELAAAHIASTEIVEAAHRYYTQAA